MGKKSIQLVEIPKRNVITLNKQEGIFNNGIDNNYPQRVENIINSSVTAKSCAKMMARFIAGSGFEDDRLNSTVFYSDIMGDITGIELLQEIAISLAYHGAAVVNTQINGDYKVSGVKPVKYKNIRIGKTDSNGYSGKIIYNECWGRSRKKSGDIKVDCFNMIKEVLVDQIGGDLNRYSGQIAILSMDKSEVYPISPVDVCREDADTENQISQFKNGELRGGFFAKYIIHHSVCDLDEEKLKLKNALGEFMSGGHESSVLLLEGSFDQDGKWLDSMNIKVEKIEQNINDKIFEGYEKTIANNIRKSFNAIPKILIDSEDSGVFGQSGAAFVEAVKFYNMQTSEFRTAAAQFLKKIMKYHTNDDISIIDNYNIKPLSYGIVDTSGSAAE